MLLGQIFSMQKKTIYYLISHTKSIPNESRTQMLRDQFKKFQQIIKYIHLRLDNATLNNREKVKAIKETLIHLTDIKNKNPKYIPQKKNLHKKVHTKMLKATLIVIRKKQKNKRSQMSFRKKRLQNETL